MNLTQKYISAYSSEYNEARALLIQCLKAHLQKRKFRTEVFESELIFGTPVGFTTHSGENELAGMKIFRSGKIAVKKLPGNELEIVCRSNLSHLLFMVVCSMIAFSLAFVYFVEPGDEIKFIILVFIFIGFIVFMVIYYIKSEINALIRQALRDWEEKF